jgi:RNase P subunit RPR2
MKSLPKLLGQEKIKELFSQDNFTSKSVKKIKKIAMKNQIRLGKLRQNFCKYCHSKLKGKTRVTKTHKTINCQNCQKKNKLKLEPRKINF